MRYVSCRCCAATVLTAATLLGFSAFTPRARANAAGQISLPKGFHAELVYSVPIDQQGSWVCLTIDGKGRLIASDQYGGLFRIEPSALGADASKTKVEPIEVTIGNAQGLLAVGPDLYVVMNGSIGAFGSGLYRLSDSNGDDKYDHLQQLRVFRGEGEHGPHAVVLGPDGKSLYMVCGNFTEIPLFDRTLAPPHWGEDQLLPRLNDPMGQTNDRRAPGGWVIRTDLEGKNLELFSIGFRNAYDLAFNADGELLTFDSDMEWDIGTPWYRPTRVCHVVSGSDFGWRGGNGPWPQYYIDTLPTVADVGPGSPTGLAFGTGTKFPERYQRALFAGDWSYGNIYAIHLTPNGASYRGEVERFASAMPLGVTDMVVRPQDGALYFTVGGRKSASALYRIVADGVAPPPAGADANASIAAAAAENAAKLRTLRRSIEKLHSDSRAGVVDAVWPYLGHADRFVRYAARVAVELQPVAQWRARALAEAKPQARVQALAALARCGTREDQAKWAKSLTELKFADLNHDDRLDYLRTAALGVMRFDPLEDAVKKQLIDALDASFPTGDHLTDRELGAVLIRLDAGRLVERLLAELEGAATQEEGIDVAVQLSAVKSGWTLPQRTAFFDWFDRAASIRGGLSSFAYVVAARDRFIAAFPDADRLALAARVDRQLVQSKSTEPAKSRPFVKEWKLDELTALAEKDAGPRDLANGRRMFAAASCYSCHRVAGEGSSVGPDLTGVGGRFGVRDILRSIVEPNHEVSDQYRQMVFETNGRVITGRVTNLVDDALLVSTDMLDPKKEIKILRDEIDKQYQSETSLMPTGLLNTLSEAEILDLLAYLRSAGQPVVAAPVSAQ